jgi:hypothetical protein
MLPLFLKLPTKIRQYNATQQPEDENTEVL